MNQPLDPYGRTPLHYAALKNDVSGVQAAIEAGDDINLADTREHYTPLHFAVQEGAVEAAALLLERGADISMETENPGFPKTRQTVLHLAVARVRLSQDGAMLRLLLNNGASKTWINGQGLTPLQYSHSFIRFPDGLRELLS